MKHAEHILCIDNNYLLSLGLKEGFNPMTEDLYARLFNTCLPALEFRQRAGLDAKVNAVPDRKQPLPYMVFSRPNVDGEKTYLTYLRKPSVGEERLSRRLSIAPGGHIELDDRHMITHVDSGTRVLDFYGTVKRNMYREALEEVRFFFDMGVEAIHVEEIELAIHNAALMGLLFDHSDEVGQYHLGMVYEVVLPQYIHAEIKDPDLINLGWLTRRQIAELPYQPESWTRLLLEQAH